MKNVKTRKAVNPETQKATEVPKTMDVGAAFDALVAAGKVEVFSDGEGGEVYIVSRKTNLKLEAVKFAERFEKMDSFDLFIALAFQEGMQDVLKTVRRELMKLGPMYGKAVIKVVDPLARWIKDQTDKVKTPA